MKVPVCTNVGITTNKKPISNLEMGFLVVMLGRTFLNTLSEQLLFIRRRVFAFN